MADYCFSYYMKPEGGVWGREHFTLRTPRRFRHKQYARAINEIDNLSLYHYIRGLMGEPIFTDDKTSVVWGLQMESIPKDLEGF